MSDENVTPLFGGQTSAPAAPEPRTYTVRLKGDDTDFGPMSGYLVTNGYIVCILEEYDNVNTVVFLANQGDLLYVLETDEVDPED